MNSLEGKNLASLGVLGSNMPLMTFKNGCFEWHDSDRKNKKRIIEEK